MFLIQALLTNDNDQDYKHNIIIGLFTSSEKAILAARNWLKEEREGGSKDNIVLYGWCLTPDIIEMCPTDMSKDDAALEISKAFRSIEKEFPITSSDE